MIPLAPALSALRVVPAWAWALAAALAWGAIQHHRATAAGQALLEQQRAVAEAQVKAERDARIETERRMAATKEVADEADRRAASAQADADAASGALGRLRAQLKRSMPAGPAASGAAPAGAGQAAVLADVLGECGEAVRRVAAEADHAINRGRACEAAYQSLTK